MIYVRTGARAGNKEMSSKWGSQVAESMKRGQKGIDSRKWERIKCEVKFEREKRTKIP